MSFAIKDVIKLDDENEYLIVSKVAYENKIYYFLADVKNNGNVKFCYQGDEPDSLIELDDDAVLDEKLLQAFTMMGKEGLK